MPNDTDLPYNELVFHLDLCILAYHLYHQTLIWPMDPYYEQMSKKRNVRRNDFMRSVRTKFINENKAGPYRGPGALQNWRSNPMLDPIITRYDRLNPWCSSIVAPEPGDWVFIEPPNQIVSKIGEVRMCSYPNNLPQGNGTGISKFMPNGDPQITSIAKNPKPSSSDQDLMYCFEGGTGCVERGNDTFRAPAWSMMGFVLVRYAKNNTQEYDIHIAFRGSRSGSASRAAAEAVMADVGNPDWVTDLAFFSTPVDIEISLFGAPSTGFKNSVKTMLPTIYQCLRDIAQNHATPPRRIYVTGHSLGGALAALFSSAVRQGINDYWPRKLINEPAFKPWYWNNLDLKVITFSAPTIGNWDLTNSMNSRIAGIRVHVKNDIITSDNLRGNHFGSNVSLQSVEATVGKEGHEPAAVREQLTKFLMKRGEDQKNLPTGAYRPMIKYGSFYDFWNAQKDFLEKEGGTAFPKFIENLGTYLGILSNLDKNTKALVRGIKDLMEGKVSSILKTDWQALQGTSITSGVDDALIRFIEVCYVLRLYCDSTVNKNELAVLVKGNQAKFKAT